MLEKPEGVSPEDWDFVVERVGLIEKMYAGRPSDAPPWYGLPRGRESLVRKWVVKTLVEMGYTVLIDAGDTTYVFSKTPLKNRLKGVGLWMPRPGAWKIPTKKVGEVDLSGLKVVRIPGRPILYVTPGLVGWMIEGDTYPFRDLLKKMKSYYTGEAWEMTSLSTEAMSKLLEVADLWTWETADSIVTYIEKLKEMEKLLQGRSDSKEEKKKELVSL